MREDIVGTFDGHRRFEWRDGVAVVARAHGQRRPVVAAQLEDGDGFVDAAESAGRLAEHLHQHPRAMAVEAQHLPGTREVLVRYLSE